MNRNIFMVMAGLCLVLVSCQEDFDPGNSSVYPVSGNWYVVYDYEDGASLAEDHLYIYNTATPNDSAWVDDKVFYGAKVRVHVTGNTFSVVEGEDVEFGSGLVTINGEVFEEDSIYVTFEYVDTGETVVASGHRTTGFE